jgi:hypothetical protein
MLSNWDRRFISAEAMTMSYQNDRAPSSHRDGVVDHHHLGARRKHVNDERDQTTSQ